MPDKCTRCHKEFTGLYTDNGAVIFACRTFKRYELCGECRDKLEEWIRGDIKPYPMEVSFYDKEETHENCTVQVLTNTETGDVSVGWWEGTKSEIRS